MNFQIKKFNIENIRDRCEIDSHKSPMIVLIGKKDTGKSFLVRDILANTQACFPVGTVISGTEVANPFFQDMVPSKLIHDKYKPEIVMNAIKRQMAVKQAREHEKKRTGGNSGMDPRAFLILDDCLYDKTWINEESTRYVFMNGRHIDMVTLITMQYPLGVSPNLRTNIDFVFILRENNISNRKRIYDNYAGMFPTFEMFCQFMDQCTENYECLVICNGVQSNKLEDQVFWYKADQNVNFKMCSQELWHMQSAHDEKEALGLTTPPDDEESYNPSTFEVKKKTPPIRVVRKHG
jgi:hypothetical protein